MEKPKSFDISPLTVGELIDILSKFPRDLHLLLEQGTIPGYIDGMVFDPQGGYGRRPEADDEPVSDEQVTEKLDELLGDFDGGLGADYPRYPAIILCAET